MIPTIMRQYKRWVEIADGYGRFCDKLKFFIDPLTYEEEQALIYTTMDIMKFVDYPSSNVQKDNFEFEFVTNSGNRGVVVVVPMKRRKLYFEEDNHNLESLKALKEGYGTWNKYKEFFDENYKPIGICADRKPCRHIWEKVWRSFVYIKQHDILFSHWFLKIDDDTFFIPSNFRKYIALRGLHHDEPHYFGHLATTENSARHIGADHFVKFVSGVCSAFSRKSIDVMTNTYQRMNHEYGPRDKFPNSHGICVDRDGATEERVTSKCLLDSGIKGNLAAEWVLNRFQVNIGDKERPIFNNYYDTFTPVSELPENLIIDEEEAEKKKAEFYKYLKHDVLETANSQSQPKFVKSELEKVVMDPWRKHYKAELVLPLGLPFTLTYKRKASSTSWYWKEKTLDRGDMLNCCSFHAYGIHGYKSSTRLKSITELVYDLSLEAVMDRFNQAKVGSENWWYLYYIIKLRQNM